MKINAPLFFLYQEIARLHCVNFANSRAKPMTSLVFSIQSSIAFSSRTTLACVRKATMIRSK